MDWQAAGDWQGGTPGQDAGLPALLAAFGHGGAWEAAAPSAALAVALETAAGPGGVYEDADTDALVGIARQWAAVESWAAAGLLGALRSMMRDDDNGTPVLGRRAGRAGLPGGWDDSLNYEIAAALAMGPVSAQNLAHLAWTLGVRLPGIGRLLAGGTLTRSKARLVAQLFEPLDEGEAARAEALILGELEGRTYPQVERLAWRAALAVAPDAAERRRSGAERRARVTVFREEAGTVGLSGRDLPAAEALAGHANVVARARVYAASGAFPGQDAGRLEAQAYLDLLGGLPAKDRIAFAAAVNADPPGAPGPDDAGPDDDEGPFGGDDDGGRAPGRGDGGGDAPSGQAGGGGGGHGPRDSGGGSRAPDDDDDDDDAADVSGSPDLDDDDDDPGDDGDDDADVSRSPDLDDDDDDPGDDGDDGIPGPGGDGGIPGPAGGGDGSGPDPGGDGDIPVLDGGGGDGDGPDPGGDGGGDEGPGGPEAPEAPRPPLVEVTVPLATLQGEAERAGDSRLLGPLDPALARHLAAAAARSPHSRWEITVVDEHGYAIGHGTARPIRGTRPPPRPPGPALAALPARVNITVTETFLQRLAQTSRPRSGAPPGEVVDGKPRPAEPPGHWELTPGKPGSWALTLLGGRRLTVRFDVVPTHDCDHRNQTSAYEPGETLRRLVQVRDHDCTFPTCSRAARDSDFEHAVPYDKGGRTCGCNAGARSRRCHRVKRLDRHSAQARLARVDNPRRPHLHPGTLALHRLTGLAPARAYCRTFKRDTRQAYPGIELVIPVLVPLFYITTLCQRCQRWQARDQAFQAPGCWCLGRQGSTVDTELLHSHRGAYGCSFACCLAWCYQAAVRPGSYGSRLAGGASSRRYIPRDMVGRRGLPQH